MTDPLLPRLRTMLDGADPVPGEVVAAAMAAFDWHDPDAQLALLVDTTTVGAADVRGEDGVLRTYQAGDVEVDVETGYDGRTVVVHGQIAPPRAMTVRIEQPGGTRETTADDWGRFSFTGLAPGPARLSFGSPPARTPWIVL